MPIECSQQALSRCNQVGRGARLDSRQRNILTFKPDHPGRVNIAACPDNVSHLCYDVWYAAVREKACGIGRDPDRFNKSNCASPRRRHTFAQTWIPRTRRHSYNKRLKRISGRARFVTHLAQTLRDRSAPTTVTTHMSSTQEQKGPIRRWPSGFWTAFNCWWHAEYQRIKARPTSKSISRCASHQRRDASENAEGEGFWRGPCKALGSAFTSQGGS